MQLVKIAIGNVDPTVGAFRKNADRILIQAARMAEEGCHVAAFGESSISGYPCEDLVQWATFVDQQGAVLDYVVRSLDDRFRNIVLVVGLTVHLDGSLYNVAAVIADGRIVGLVPKENLPDYNVFYEGRTISPGVIGMSAQVRNIPIGDMIFEFGFGKMSTQVCEDIWRMDGPMVRRNYSGAMLDVCINASPYRFGARQTRHEMISTRAADNCTTVAYVNLVGGQDGLVFEGGGYVNQGGRMLLVAERGREGYQTQVVDLDRVRRMRMENTTWRRARDQYLKDHKSVPVVTDERLKLVAPPNNALPYPFPKNKSFFLPQAEESRLCPRDEYFSDLEMIIGIGMMGYFRKTGAFKRFLIALSGGKDSVLTLLLAHAEVSKEADRRGLTGEDRAAFVKDMIYCVDMPSKFNSDETRGITRQICDDLGITLIVSPIHEAVEQERKSLLTALGVTRLKRSTEHNLQARVRGERMQNLCNEYEGLWLQTSNMSEKAVGYTTVGGDMMGGLSLIANLPKTVVIEFIRWYFERLGLEVLRDLLASKASAELEKGQEDERDLMPFPVLDALFALFVGEKMTIHEVRAVVSQMWSADELVAMDRTYTSDRMDEWVKRFVRLFFASIFKWVQCPLSIHLGTLDLERERALQLPVAQDRTWAEAA